MDQLKRESLNRSLNRLGRWAAADNMPDVFVKNELAIAVRRFGVWPIAKTIITQLRDDRRIQRRMETYYGS